MYRYATKRCKNSGIHHCPQPEAFTLASVQLGCWFGASSRQFARQSVHTIHRAIPYPRLTGILQALSSEHYTASMAPHDSAACCELSSCSMDLLKCTVFGSSGYSWEADMATGSSAAWACSSPSHEKDAWGPFSNACGKSVFATPNAPASSLTDEDALISSNLLLANGACEVGAALLLRPSRAQQYDREQQELGTPRLMSTQEFSCSLERLLNAHCKSPAHLGCSPRRAAFQQTNHVLNKDASKLQPLRGRVRIQLKSKSACSHPTDKQSSGVTEAVCSGSSKPLLPPLPTYSPCSDITNDNNLAIPAAFVPPQMGDSTLSPKSSFSLSEAANDAAGQRSTTPAAVDTSNTSVSTPCNSINFITPQVTGLAHAANTPTLQPAPSILLPRVSVSRRPGCLGLQSVGSATSSIHNNLAASPHMSTTPSTSMASTPSLPTLSRSLPLPANRPAAAQPPRGIPDSTATTMAATVNATTDAPALEVRGPAAMLQAQPAKRRRVIGKLVNVGAL